MHDGLDKKKEKKKGIWTTACAKIIHLTRE